MNVEVYCGVPETDFYLKLSWHKFGGTTLILGKQKSEISLADQYDDFLRLKQLFKTPHSNKSHEDFRNGYTDPDICHTGASLLTLLNELVL